MSDIRTERAPKPVGAYPHARRVGPLLFLSGVGPRTPGSDVVPDGIDAQTRAVFANVRTILEVSGARWDQLVDVTVFLTHMAEDFATFNQLYAEAFTDAQPCRTTVEVNALPTPIRVELKCIAWIDEA